MALNCGVGLVYCISIILMDSSSKNSENMIVHGNLIPSCEDRTPFIHRPPIAVAAADAMPFFFCTFS